MGVMSARRLSLTIVACFCGLVGVFGVGVGLGVAGAAQLGATQIGLTEGEHRGEGAGQLARPDGVAVNNDSSSLFSGDLYVVDQADWRLDRFAVSSGAFQLAWGSGVADGAKELQTCTTSCESGLREEEPPYVTGGIHYGTSVTVDSDPLSSSAGDVYVANNETDRVEKFGPSGEFLLTFGGEVNEGKDDTPGATEAEKNVCVVGEKCRQGTGGTADGHFESLSEGNNIAVGPGGLVYVGDTGRVQVFEPSAVWKEAISLSGLSSTGKVTALAVDSSGDVFVKDGEAAGVHEFEPGGLERSTQFDAGSTSVASIAVDGSGDLFVGDSNGGLYDGFHVLKYDISSGKAVGDFGSNTVRGGETNVVHSFGPNGMAFSEASGSADLYVSEHYVAKSEHVNEPTTFDASVWVLPVPPPGPSVEGESATPGPRDGSAVLEGVVSPEGNETKYHFEYVGEEEFQTSGYAHALSTPAGTLAASLVGQPVSARVTGLPPSSFYHFRIVATNEEKGTAHTATGPDRTFETLPPASIGLEYSTNVAATSATLSAEVNPFEVSTEDRLEYGSSASYGHIVVGNLGEGSAEGLVSFHLQELSAMTTYHYRFVLSNAFGTVEGADRTFSTQGSGGELALPDGRAWELVSPPDKKGALIESFAANGDEIQAASDGSGLAYLTSGPHVGEGPQGKILWSPVLSTRVPGGWRSVDLSLPRRFNENGEPTGENFTLYPEYQLFSEDLSLAAVDPEPTGTPLLSPEATERTVYLREDSNGSYEPLVTAANVLPGTKFGGEFGGHREVEEMTFITATPDLSHVVLGSPVELTPGAGTNNLYEWSAGRLQPVDILPQDEGGGTDRGSTLAGGFTSELGPVYNMIPSAISSDGRRIAWQDGHAYGGGVGSGNVGLYVRDMVEERTVRVGGQHAAFQWMNSDGSEVFYIEEGDLRVFDVDNGTQTDLTADHGAGEASGGVQELVSDVSKDGSYVYFVATGVLGNAAGAISGENNLYLLHDTGSGWSTTYIATLSGEDEKDWFMAGSEGGPDLSGVTSRVSPDGRYLAFMSNRSLTGYDNHDALSGKPDEEVYLYDAHMGRLVCVSCDPTGARPVGVLDENDEKKSESLLIDRGNIWTQVIQAHHAGTVHWLAGVLPAWDSREGHGSHYQPRYLSDGGRLFFDSPDALVPQATNGASDVYEYEPAGEGGCASSSATFGKSSGGCVGLISSGTSSEESAFFDASESGDDAFFITASRLVAADYDNDYDVYDAHVCSTGVPCVSAPVSSPPCSSGDSCKAAPSPQPEIFGPAPSATFSGTGNVVEEAGKSVKPKSKQKSKKKTARKKKKKGKLGKKGRVGKVGKSRRVRASRKGGR
jgi:hypothetical protein